MFLTFAINGNVEEFLDDLPAQPPENLRLAMEYSCRYGHLPIVEILFELHRSEWDSIAEVALDAAIDHSRHDVVEYLLKHGPSVPVPCPRIRYWLQMACFFGDLKMVQLLIPAFISVLTPEDLYGSYVLIRKEHSPIKEYFIRHPQVFGKLIQHPSHNLRSILIFLESAIPHFKLMIDNFTIPGTLKYCSLEKILKNLNLRWIENSNFYITSKMGELAVYSCGDFHALLVSEEDSIPICGTTLTRQNVEIKMEKITEPLDIGSRTFRPEIAQASNVVEIDEPCEYCLTFEIGGKKYRVPTPNEHLRQFGFLK